MIKQIVKCLKSVAEVSGYYIANTDTNDYEAYYVLQKLEMMRKVKTSEYVVTVYTKMTVDGKDVLGEATFSVPHKMANKQLCDKIKEALYAAKFAKNQYYELPYGEKKRTWKSNVHFDNPEEILDKTATTFFSVAKDYKKFNALEVFLKQRKVRVVNSNGVDYTKNIATLEVEAIPSYDGDKEDIVNRKVEVYKYFKYNDFNQEKIKQDAVHALEEVEARYNAKKIENISCCDVVLKEKEIRELARDLIADYSFASVYRGGNSKKIGESIQTAPVGELLTISLAPSGKSDGFDNAGVIKKPTTVIDKGIITNYHGDHVYAQYLNMESTGRMTYIKVKKGKMTKEKMESKKHIEILALSGIQIDTYSGYIGGEVRLANYCEGGKKYPISGFSFSGNLNEVLNDLAISSEVVENLEYSGPSFILMKNLNIL